MLWVVDLLLIFFSSSSYFLFHAEYDNRFLWSVYMIDAFNRRTVIFVNLFCWRILLNAVVILSDNGPRLNFWSNCKIVNVSISLQTFVYILVSGLCALSVRLFNLVYYSNLFIKKKIKRSKLIHSYLLFIWFYTARILIKSFICSSTILFKLCLCDIVLLLEGGVVKLRKICKLSQIKFYLY